MIDPPQRCYFCTAVSSVELFRQDVHNCRQIKLVFLILRFLFDKTHLGCVDSPGFLPDQLPLLVVVSEAGEDGGEDAGGEGQHLGAGETDELSDPGDGHHLQSHSAGLGVRDQDVDHPREIHHLKQSSVSLNPVLAPVETHLGLVNDVTQELSEEIITEGRDLGAGIVQNVEKRIQELGQMLNHLRVGNTVQQADPGHQELSYKLVSALDWIY